MANAFMQSVYVGDDDNSHTSLTTGAPASSTVAGNLLVVVVGTANLRTVSSVTDSASNVYTRGVHINTDFWSGEIWYCASAASVSSSGGSWTANISGSNNLAILVLEYSGLGNCSVSMSTTKASTSNVDTITSGAAVSGDLFISCRFGQGKTGETCTADVGNNRHGSVGGVDNPIIGAIDILSATSGSTTVTWTVTDNSGDMLVITFTPEDAPPKISFVNVGAAATNNASPQTATLPASAQAGDLLLLLCLQSSTAAVTFASSGYISLARNSDATRVMTLEILGKIHSGSESNPSVTCSSAASGWIVAMVAYRGVDQAIIQDATAVLSNAAAAQTFQPTGITVSMVWDWVLSVVGSKDDNTLNFNTANGYTSRMAGAGYQGTLGSGSDYSLGLADQEFSSSGAKTCPTWNESANGNDAWVALTLALKPLGLMYEGNDKMYRQMLPV